MKFNMASLKLLLSSSLIYIAIMATAISIDKITENVQRNALINKLSDYILPLHYNMKLELLEEYFIGEYVITIYIIHATQEISFHILHPISITKYEYIRLELKQNDNRVHYETMSSCYTDNIVQSCIKYKFENVLLPGMYNLNINVKIPINIIRDSFGTSYINDDGNKEWLITIIDAQTKNWKIFRFWNKPELRTTFDISIKHHRRYKVLSNMQYIMQESETLVDNAMVWTYFNNIDSISIDNIAFVKSDFHETVLTETVSMWCRPNMISHMTFALYVAENITMYLKNYWNISERFLVSSKSKEYYFVIPNLQNEVKQTLGFVFYREADITYSDELDTTGRKMIIASLIARGIIQKYIDNLLNPSYWFQLWLNESFNIFLQAYIVDKVLPYSGMMDLFAVQVQHELFDLNTHIVINSAVGYSSYPENYLFSSVSHFKGSIIWRMLERTMSPDKFSKIINIYLNIRYAKPVERTSDNLWKAMQKVIDELDSEYQFHIKSTVHSWAMQRCFPVLEVMRNYSRDVVTISVFFHDKLDEKQYYIPVTYTTESKPNFTITWSNISLTPSNSKFELFLEKDQWIILNLQQAGYYRVNYDTENWRKIARYLNSKEYKNIHVLNRAQIIDDAFHFAIEKKLESPVFWELATYLHKEKDYIAWYPMLKALEFISNTFRFYDCLFSCQELLYLLDLTWDLFRKDINDDRIKCLKEELAKWKCIIDDDMSCKTWANNQLQLHLKNPQKNKILPGWKRWTYCNGLKTIDRDQFNKINLFNENKKKIDHTILECLAYVENSEIIIDYILITLPGILQFYRNNPSYHNQSTEQVESLTTNIFLFTVAKNTKPLLEGILKNFQNIRYYFRQVDDVVALIVIINNVYSEKELDQINKVISEKIETSIKISDVKRKIDIRRSQIKRQNKYFQFLFSH